MGNQQYIVNSVSSIHTSDHKENPFRFISPSFSLARRTWILLGKEMHWTEKLPAWRSRRLIQTSLHWEIRSKIDRKLLSRGKSQGSGIPTQRSKIRCVQAWNHWADFPPEYGNFIQASSEFKRFINYIRSKTCRHGVRLEFVRNENGWCRTIQGLSQVNIVVD